MHLNAIALLFVPSVLCFSIPFKFVLTLLRTAAKWLYVIILLFIYRYTVNKHLPLSCNFVSPPPSDNLT